MKRIGWAVAALVAVGLAAAVLLFRAPAGNRDASPGISGAKTGAEEARPGTASPSSLASLAQAPPADAGPDDLVELTADGEGDLLHVVAASHAFLVPPSNAARVALEPEKAYRVWTTGSLYLEEPVGTFTESAVFFASGPGISAEGSFGLFGPNPRTITGVSMLYVFVPSLRPIPSRGGLLVHVAGTAKPGHAPLELAVAAVEVPDSDSFVLEGLDPQLSYELRVRPGAPAARTRGDAGGEVGRVLCLRVDSRGPPPEASAHWSAEALNVLTPGRAVRVEGAERLQLVFPDDDLGDNQGELLVEVRRRNGSAPGSEGHRTAAMIATAEASALVAEAEALPGRAQRVQRLYDRGMEKLMQKSLGDARVLLEACVENDPAFPPCRKMLGALYAKLGDSERSAMQFRKFLEVAAPGDKDAAKVHAILDTVDEASESGEVAKAIEAAKAAADPAMGARALADSAQRQLAMGRPLSSQRLFGECLLLDPRMAACHKGLGDLFAEVDWWTAAMHYQACLAAAPNGPDAAAVRALLDRHTEAPR